MSYFSLIIFWLTFEYIHLNWDLSWPWLTLGNSFSESLYLINWYEYTGVLGGSFWIILLNILFFEFFRTRNFTKIYSILFVLIVPILISNLISKQDANLSSGKLNVVIVQPNVDPYKEKFSLSFTEQLNDFIVLAKNKLDSNTNLLVGPETALQEAIWESKVNYAESIIELKKLQLEFPKLNILLGASTYKLFKKEEEKKCNCPSI